MQGNHPSEFSLADAAAKIVILKTEKALQKHIRLIKNRKRMTTVVATLERLKSSLRERDVAGMRQWIRQLDQLTQGFAERAVKHQRAHGKN